MTALQVVSKAVAEKALAARRQQVHQRYIKSWAKKMLVTPELAAVPLKEVGRRVAVMSSHNMRSCRWYGRQQLGGHEGDMRM